MATRAAYRLDLKNKLLALEDGGYGDFDYTDPEHDTFLALSVARLFPALYKKIAQTGLTLTTYGTKSFASITPAQPDRVFLIVDAELEAVRGWRVVGSKIVGFDRTCYPTQTTFDVYYTDAYVMPADDVTDVGLSAQYQPLVVLGALIEALEARQDTGVRGDPPPSGQFSETQLLDRLIPRYEKIREDMAMSLPAVLL